MIGGLIIIVAMLITAMMMLWQQSFVTLTVPEFIGLRCGISVYSGWLTAATILNTCHMTKSLGVRKENGWNEVR